MFAFGLLVAVAAAALAIDYARAVTAKKMLANAVDAAALAAASRLPDAAAARASAIAYVEKNIPSDEYGTVVANEDVETGTWDSTNRKFSPASGPGSSATAVRVTARMSKARGNELSNTFAAVFGRDGQEISVSAVAGRGGPPCVFALHQKKKRAMLLDSNAQLVTIGCSVQINSSADGALRIDSNGSLIAADICVTGTAELPGSGDVSPDPNEYCPRHGDPMAGIDPPEISGCDHNDKRLVDATTTISPGTYCGGIEVDGNSNVTFSDGVYVLRDGPLNVLSNSKITGSQVTIYLTGSNSVLFFDSNASIAMTAPTAGPFTGVLFYQDASAGGVHNWNGNSTTTLRGVIYLPSGRLKSENVNKITPTNSCTVLIANSIEFNSNSGVSIDVTKASCRNSLPGPYRRGVVLLQ